jgi:predicted GNAT family acetyltransferase
MNVPERRIRRAKPDDISVVSEFDHESTKNERKEFIHRAVGNDNAYFLEQNGKVIAVGILEYAFFEHGFISLVYVDPRERRTGIGEMLLRYLVSVCRTSKLFASTNLPMHALFAKLGFKVSGMIYNLDPKDPEVIYFKTLSVNPQA